MPELLTYFLGLGLGLGLGVALGMVLTCRDPRENSGYIQDVADWLGMALPGDVSDADALARMAGFVEGRDAERPDEPDENTARAIVTVNGVEVFCEKIALAARPDLSTPVMLQVIPDDKRTPVCASLYVESLETEREEPAEGAPAEARTGHGAGS